MTAGDIEANQANSCTYSTMNQIDHFSSACGPRALSRPPNFTVAHGMKLADAHQYPECLWLRNVYVKHQAMYRSGRQSLATEVQASLSFSRHELAEAWLRTSISLRYHYVQSTHPKNLLPALSGPTPLYLWLACATACQHTMIAMTACKRDVGPCPDCVAARLSLKSR